MTNTVRRCVWWCSACFGSGRTRVLIETYRRWRRTLRSTRIRKGESRSLYGRSTKVVYPKLDWTRRQFSGDSNQGCNDHFTAPHRDTNLRLVVLKAITLLAPVKPKGLRFPRIFSRRYPFGRS
jgi:hypothetical protein